MPVIQVAIDPNGFVGDYQFREGNQPVDHSKWQSGSDQINFTTNQEYSFNIRGGFGGSSFKCKFDDNGNPYDISPADSLDNAPAFVFRLKTRTIHIDCGSYDGGYASNLDDDFPNLIPNHTSPNPFAAIVGLEGYVWNGCSRGTAQIKFTVDENNQLHLITKGSATVRNDTLSILAATVHVISRDAQFKVSGYDAGFNPTGDNEVPVTVFAGQEFDVIFSDDPTAAAIQQTSTTTRPKHPEVYADPTPK